MTMPSSSVERDGHVLPCGSLRLRLRPPLTSKVSRHVRIERHHHLRARKATRHERGIYEQG